MIYVVIKVIFKIKKMYLNVMDFILCYLLIKNKNISERNLSKWRIFLNKIMYNVCVEF